MRVRAFWIAVAALVLGPITARGQFAQGAAFEPEIDVVNTGVVMDAQATVSADRKYVTINMRTQQSTLLALQTFQFQQGGVGGFVQLPGGVVGGVNPVVAGREGAIIPQQPNVPVRVSRGKGGVILLRRGVTPLVMGG